MKDAQWKNIFCEAVLRVDRVVQSVFFSPVRSRAGWAVVVLCLGCFGWAYFSIGGELISQTNLDMQRSDQLAMIKLSRRAESDWIPFRSDYVQPLWPWVARVVMTGDDEEFFFRGRKLNLVLGFALTSALGVFAARRISFAAALVVPVVFGFGVMLQRAHFFHPEPLLYFFFACSIWFMAATLARSRWTDHLAWGGFLGLAALTKGSTEPLVALFLGATAVRLLFMWNRWPSHWIARSGAAWSWKRHAAGFFLALGSACVISAPNMWFKWEIHGDPFFNPAKYWMWCDDWDLEANPLTAKIQTRDQREAFPPGELPTARNYLNKYGLDHAAARWTAGMTEIGHRMLLPALRWDRTIRPRRTSGSESRGEADKVWNYLLPARTVYVAILLSGAVLVWVAFASGRHMDTGPPFSPGGLAVLALVLAMLTGYLALFGWYAPIGRGERFTLMLVLPVLGIGLWGARDLGHRMNSLRGAIVRAAYAGLVIWILWNATAQIARMLRIPYFGLGV